MKQRLSFTIETEADAAGLLDQLTAFAEGLVEDLDPREDWHGNTFPAFLCDGDEGPSVDEVTS